MLHCYKPTSLQSNSNYNVLVIEDMKLMNNLITKRLNSLNYNCTQSFTYEEAKTELIENKFDFILLDLNLPDAYGEELVQSIGALSNAKIIILTVESDIQIRESLFKYGILDYVLKDEYLNNSIDNIDKTIQSIADNVSMKVLVIDDSRFMCMQMEKILNVRNYEVITALNAKDGMEILNNYDVNLVILDMELPDKHGLDVLREIKSNQNICSIPVIVISGTNDPETVRNSLKLGSSDYIKKPFNIEEFVLKVDHAVYVNKKDREILCSRQLLSEYKDTVDRSSIVSKTDPKGVITFVNDKFCEISGYTREELLGKSHKIVRHPDVPASIFQEMWETIKSKQSWHGEIKNINKNGKAYYVDTIINPIIDYDGNIVEYIGIRTDITELEKIKENLEDKLHISNDNFDDAYKKSQEYQAAINQSSIVSRMDLDKKITYVNDEFCKISGYDEAELIGNTNDMLRHKDNPKKIYTDLWNTVASGKTWKGQLKSKAKDGSSYYIKNTIIPIFDKNDKIEEYISIMFNITDIVAIHKELEYTQKEVIYKMGEVGETRSKETGFHVKRVAEYSKLLARLAGLSKESVELLYAASPMHDIGKVGIPDSVLLKPGKLNEQEWEIMKKHSEMGYNILKDSKRSILKAAAIVAYRHHEKWDGSGYPNGISGKDIHIFGRITAIVDVFDALGSDREYKKAWELERILELLREERGKHFDPKLVDLFLGNLDKFLKIRDRYTDT